MQILIIEADNAVATLMRTFLEKDGHEVVSMVHNGMAALQALNIYKPDLIVLDVHLPNHWADTIVHALQKKGPKMPRIILGANQLTDARYIVQRYPKCKVLLKPVTYTNLSEAVLDEPEQLPFPAFKEHQLT